MSSFCTAKATHICFSKKFQHICVSLDVNFNESLTNDVVSFEQLGPDRPAYLNSLNKIFSGCIFGMPRKQSFLMRTTKTLVKLHGCTCQKVHFLVSGSDVFVGVFFL